MRKIWIALILTVALLFCACSTGTETTVAPEKETESAPENKAESDREEEETAPATTEVVMSTTEAAMSTTEAAPPVTEAVESQAYKGYYLKVENGSEISHVIFILEGSERLAAGDWAVIRPFSSREEWSSGEGILIRSTLIQDSDPPGLVPESIEKAKLGDPAYTFEQARAAVEAKGYQVVETQSSGKALTDYSTPPALTVVCGENQSKAITGTYSWSRYVGDGKYEGIEADAIHPLEMMDLLDPLKVDDSGIVELQFELQPNSVTASCWPEEYAGGDPSPYYYKDTKLTVERGSLPLVTVPTDGGYIVLLQVHWSDSTGSGGNVMYIFRTVR